MQHVQHDSDCQPCRCRQGTARWVPHLCSLHRQQPAGRGKPVAPAWVGHTTCCCHAHAWPKEAQGKLKKSPTREAPLAASHCRCRCLLRAACFRLPACYQRASSSWAGHPASCSPGALVVQRAPRQEHEGNLGNAQSLQGPPGLGRVGSILCASRAGRFPLMRNVSEGSQGLGTLDACRGGCKCGKH